MAIVNYFNSCFALRTSTMTFWVASMCGRPFGMERSCSMFNGDAPQQHMKIIDDHNWGKTACVLACSQIDERKW